MLTNEQLPSGRMDQKERRCLPESGKKTGEMGRIRRQRSHGELMRKGQQGYGHSRKGVEQRLKKKPRQGRSAERQEERKGGKSSYSPCQRKDIPNKKGKSSRVGGGAASAGDPHAKKRSPECAGSTFKKERFFGREKKETVSIREKHEKKKKKEKESTRTQTAQYH